MRSHLALASGNDSVAGNELGHDSTGGLDTESQGVDIDKDDVERLITSEDTALNSRTIGNSLVGVDSLGRFLAEVLLEELLNLRDTSGTADEDNLR